MSLRVANGAGFWGDNLDVPRRLVETAEVDYLTLEYLAELTLSIMARQREKDPTAGYATDFLQVLSSLCPALAAQPQLKIVTNAGGMNVASCAQAAARILSEAGMHAVKIGLVTGDDLLPKLDEFKRAGCKFENLETGQPLDEFLASRPAAPGEPPSTVVSANAYLGARGIAEALAGGARIVITGRVADASLTVGPAVERFGWSWDDWQRLAGASVAGHLIECGAQVTGGLDWRWQELRLADVGYPIAEIESDSSCTITKPAKSGGIVDRHTVAEQLVYEIADPRHYLTPDVDVDFTTITLDDVGTDRVKVTGATGRPAPDTLKVSLAYRDGFMASGQLLVYGPHSIAKARSCAEIILERMKLTGYDLMRTQVELLGARDIVLAPDEQRDDPREVVLRIAVHDERREAVERFTRELAPLVTSGPPGLAGYTTAHTPVRPVYAYWPTLVPKELVATQVMVRSAKDWMTSRDR